MRRLIEVSLLLLALAAIGIAPPAQAAGAACENLESAVAGFRFYQGPALRPLLQPGTPLELRREPPDAYDPDAVAVWWGDFKLGYVERAADCDLAGHMRRGTALAARVAAPRRGAPLRLLIRPV